MRNRRGCSVGKLAHVVLAASRQVRVLRFRRHTTEGDGRGIRNFRCAAFTATRTTTILWIVCARRELLLRQLDQLAGGEVPRRFQRFCGRERPARTCEPSSRQAQYAKPIVKMCQCLGRNGHIPQLPCGPDTRTQHTKQCQTLRGRPHPNHQHNRHTTAPTHLVLHWCHCALLTPIH
jgi:hypothetical protein